MQALRRTALLGILLAGLAGCGKTGGDTSGPLAGMKELRIAARGSEEDPERAKQWTTLRDILAKVTGLPVKLYESSDYNGTIQALSSGQVDVASMAGGAYANSYAQIGDLAVPILTTREAEGNTGYYSALIVRADSPYHKLEDLRGKVIGYADFNSTSGYLFPRAKLREQGIDPDTFFSKTVMAGGHTQAVMALENGQFDATIINLSGGTPEHGFTTGPQFTMARKGMVKVEDFRTIWMAGPIPNAAIVARTDRPQAMTDVVRGVLAAVPYDHPDVWKSIGQPPGASYAPVGREHYQGVIDLREQAMSEKRHTRRKSREQAS